MLAAHAVGAFDPRDRRVEAQRASGARGRHRGRAAAQERARRRRGSADEAKAAFQAKRGADLAADAVLGVEARDKRRRQPPPPPDGRGRAVARSADALTNAAHAVRTADPAAADCAPGEASRGAPAARARRGRRRPADGGCGVPLRPDLLVRGRAVRQTSPPRRRADRAGAPTAAPGAPAAALGDATNVCLTPFPSA